MKNRLQKNTGEISSVNVYYENLQVHTEDGESYFLSPKDLTDFLNQHDFQIVKKRTRVWLKPIHTDDTGTEIITDEINEKLSAVLDRFETETKIDTAIRNISGGFAQADYSSHDREWIYVTLKWGVQNDVDDDVHEEDWKLAWNDFHSTDSIKEIVESFEPCN